MATELLTFKGCIPAVEAAFAAHAQWTALEPGLLHVASEGGQFHIKVGGLQGEHMYSRQGKRRLFLTTARLLGSPTS
jgi:hypothetical protein